MTEREIERSFENLKISVGTFSENVEKLRQENLFLKQLLSDFKRKLFECEQELQDITRPLRFERVKALAEITQPTVQKKRKKTSTPKRIKEQVEEEEF